MDKLLGFVAPALRNIVNPILNLTGSVFATVKNGVEEVAKLSDNHKKKSGVFALALGWLGIDPSAFQTIGNILNKISGWFLAV